MSHPGEGEQYPGASLIHYEFSTRLGRMEQMHVFEFPGRPKKDEWPDPTTEAGRDAITALAIAAKGDPKRAMAFVDKVANGVIVPVLQKVKALESKLAQARTHSSLSSAPCPLCRYENGKMLEPCRRCEELQEAFRARDTARAEPGRIIAYLEERRDFYDRLGAADDSAQAELCEEKGALLANILRELGVGSDPLDAEAERDKKLLKTPKKETT